MASPVPPASSRFPMPPLLASPSCRSTLLTGFVGGFFVGVVVAVALFICCRKKKRQRETAPPEASTASAPQCCGNRIFTLDEVRRCTNDFSRDRVIGEGSSGCVYRGVLSSGEKVAVKQLTRGGGQEFVTEVENLSRAHHKHVVSLVGYCIEGGQHILVYELVRNGTLKFHLHGDRGWALDWPTRLKIALGSARGLAYLHGDCHPKIIHRDIKATNILLDRKFEAKIADFGLAKCISESRSHVSTAVRGTFGYFAPEYFSSGRLTEKSDIYSFGVVLLELITGYQPTVSIENSTGLVDWVRSQCPRCWKNGNFDSLVDPLLQNDYELREMAHVVKWAVACVDQSAENRPEMSEMLMLVHFVMATAREGFFEVETKQQERLTEYHLLKLS
ncbi:hypothetical protein ACJRO7_016302 [Eucalyptus globulus]|uniref:non-specific serine/threonine protein kinase n=1 Tax=Eucalyptus globulus TaxID=34317 RepID=A0ABD3LBU1_EUCGL